MMETIVLPAQDHLARERCRRVMSGLVYPVDGVPRVARRKGNTMAAIEATSHFMLRTRSGGDIPLNVGEFQRAVHKHSERVEKWTNAAERKRPTDKKKSNQGTAADSASFTIPRTRSGGELPLNGQRNGRKKLPRDLEEMGQTPAHPTTIGADCQVRGPETGRVGSSGTGNFACHKKVVKKRTSHEHCGSTLIRTKSPEGLSADVNGSNTLKEGEDATVTQCRRVPVRPISPQNESGLMFTPPKATDLDINAMLLVDQTDLNATTVSSTTGRRGSADVAPSRVRPLGRAGSMIVEGERITADGGRAVLSRSDSVRVVDLFGSTPPKGSERWAGPGFTNSPPPSTLPLPTFPFRVKSDVLTTELSMDGLTVTDSTPASYTRIVPLLATSGVLGSSVDPSSATKQLRKLLNLNEESEIAKLNEEEEKSELKATPALTKLIEEELQSMTAKDCSVESKSLAAVVYDDVKALFSSEEMCNKMTSAATATWQLKRILQL